MFVDRNIAFEGALSGVFVPRAPTESH